jgi:hypothetical protein
MECCIAGMDDAGLPHMATRMPQLLRLDVGDCGCVPPDGVSKARKAAAGCASHCKVIFNQPGQPDYDYDSD